LCGYTAFYGNSDSEFFRRVIEVKYEWETDSPTPSNEAKKFVDRLLVRKAEDRMTLEEALAHDWILRKNNESVSVLPRIKKEGNEYQV
jgi:serine/threonine protein kinase